MDVVESLLPMLSGRSEEADLKKIADLIQDYDFEAALQLFNQMERDSDVTGHPLHDGGALTRMSD